MIRVAIVADTLSRTRSLADLLADDERLDIVDAHAASAGEERNPTGVLDVILADVIVAAGLMKHQIPRAGPPVVVVTDQPGQEELGPHRSSLAADRFFGRGACSGCLRGG